MMQELIKTFWIPLFFIYLHYFTGLNCWQNILLYTILDTWLLVLHCISDNAKHIIFIAMYQKWLKQQRAVFRCYWHCHPNPRDLHRWTFCDLNALSTFLRFSNILSIFHHFHLMVETAEHSKLGWYYGKNFLSVGYSSYWIHRTNRRLFSVRMHRKSGIKVNSWQFLPKHGVVSIEVIHVINK